MKNYLKLVRLLVIFCVLVVGIYMYYLSTYDRAILAGQAIDRETINSQNIFDIIKAGDTNAISTVLDVILQDKGFKDVFLKKDRVALFDYSQELYNKIKDDYGITHFYFHLLDGTNFVRIHDKTKFDDKITRLTFNQAVDSKIIGSGIELGKTAFALRVVKPYYDSDKLIGYIELGQEIDHFLSILKEKTENNYSIFVEKRAVDMTNWASVRAAHGFNSDWAKYVNLVEMNSTIKDSQGNEFVSKCLSEENAQKVFDSKNASRTIIGSVGNNTSCAGFDLLDASGAKIGVVLLSSDISADLAIIDNFIYTQIVFIVILLIFVFSLLFYVSRKNLEAQKKYKYLFDGSEDAILTLVPPNWAFFDGNGSALRLFGLKDIKELKKITPDKVSPEYQPSGSLSSVMAKEMIDIALNTGSHSFEWVHKKITGEEFTANVLLTKIELKNEIILQAIVRNITKQKELEKSAERAMVEAKKALSDAETLNKYMVGRELKMVELKKKINESNKK